MKMVSCKEYVELKKEQLKEKVSTFETEPVLVVVQVDSNPASNAYVNGKKRDAQELGIRCLHIIIDSAKISQEELEEIIYGFNEDKYVNGIIVQLPIPDKYNVEKLQNCISPEKEVDGFRKDSLFKPCTPLGVINYLTYNEYDFVGKTACVIGRSNIVGKPLAKMLTDLNATVILCHSKTSNHQLVNLISDSDIIFTCIDKIEHFKSYEFYSWQDIIDIGLGRGEDGKLHGNIDAASVESLKETNYGSGHFIISGTGGVGLLTRISLMQNVVEAYEMQNKII